MIVGFVVLSVRWQTTKSRLKLEVTASTRVSSVPMADITEYARDRIADFCTTLSGRINDVLRTKFGDDWVENGVRPYCSPDLEDELDRAQALLQGHWPLFKNVIIPDLRRVLTSDKFQTLICGVSRFRDDIVSGRTILTDGLIQHVSDCALLLRGLQSEEFPRFEDVSRSLSAGERPWGRVLDGRIPRVGEIVDEQFVGRPAQLAKLADWLATTDDPQIQVWGYGGSGKSSIAYKFVRSVRDRGNPNLLAVCWVSAKVREYVDGQIRERDADFATKDELVMAIWYALYGYASKTIDEKLLLDELREIPILLVVDDFDTVQNDSEVAKFLIFSIRNTKTKVIYTTRQRIPAITDFEVVGFGCEELRDFISIRAHTYNMALAEREKILAQVDTIMRLTQGYPLFVDDFLRQATLHGLKNAIDTWTHRQGDAAREYSLRSQVQHLGEAFGNLLIALSLPNRALTISEVSIVAGLTEEDTGTGIETLLTWRLVQKLVQDDPGYHEANLTPAYQMNSNTRRLVQQTYRGDPRVEACLGRLETLEGVHVPTAMRHAIGTIISEGMRRVHRGTDAISVIEYIESQMDGELSRSADLFGYKGWLYSICDRGQTVNARQAFEKSVELGSKKHDTYYHWAAVEAREQNWEVCESICSNGIERCGPSLELLYRAGDAAAQVGGGLESCNNFTDAHTCRKRSLKWYRDALVSPSAGIGTVSRDQIFRDMSRLSASLGDDVLLDVLKEWRRSTTTSGAFNRECVYWMRRKPAFQDVAEFAYLIPQV